MPTSTKSASIFASPAQLHFQDPRNRLEPAEGRFDARARGLTLPTRESELVQDAG